MWRDGNVPFLGNSTENRKTFTLNASMTVATLNTGGVPGTAIRATLCSAASSSPNMRLLDGCRDGAGRDGVSH